MTEEKQSYGMSENLCEGFMTETLCEGFMTEEQFALQASGIVYNQGKAKIFNVLEAIMSSNMPGEKDKLYAAKRLVEDIISNIAKDVKTFIVDMLGEGWQQPVYFDPEDALTGEGEKAAQQEFDEVEEVLR